MSRNLMAALVVCTIAAIGAGVVFFSNNAGSAKTNQAEDTIVECGEINRKRILNAVDVVFASKIQANAITDLVCAKTAFTSDLFALGRLDDAADLSALTMGPADDWQQARLDAARRNFPDRLPPEHGPAARVTSGFAGGGDQIVVIADYGEAGRLVYVEL